MFWVALGPPCSAWVFSSWGERGLLFLVELGLLIVLASLVAEHKFYAFGLQQFCGMWVQHLQLMGSRARDQCMWYTDVVVSRHVGSSLTRDWTHIPRTGRQILNHWPQGSPSRILFYDCIIGCSSILLSCFHFLFIMN